MQGKPVLICILVRLLGFDITLEITKIASYKSNLCSPELVSIAIFLLLDVRC